MARRVFFSFHYANDVKRANVVRNSWVTQGKESAGFVDKAEFEKVLKKGDKAVEDWIDKQLNNTSVTVVLIGTETLNRPYVQYEICQSINRGNAIVGVTIHNIKDMNTLATASAGTIRTVIGTRGDKNIYFDDIVDGIYDYINNDGYSNLGSWIEAAAKKHNK